MGKKKKRASRQQEQQEQATAATGSQLVPVAPLPLPRRGIFCSILPRGASRIERRRRRRRSSPREKREGRKEGVAEAAATAGASNCGDCFCCPSRFSCPRRGAVRFILPPEASRLEKRKRREKKLLLLPTRETRRRPGPFSPLVLFFSFFLSRVPLYSSLVFFSLEKEKRTTPFSAVIERQKKTFPRRSLLSFSLSFFFTNKKTRKKISVVVVRSKRSSRR